MRKLTCPPNVELLGLYIDAFVSNIQGAETRPIMEKYGLANLDPHGWYPCHKWMDALNELAQLPNVTENMVAVGMEIGKAIPVPPGVENLTLEQMLMGLDGAYQGVHRNSDVGKYTCERLNDKHLKVTCNDLYPEDLTYGIVYVFAKRFLPPKTAFKVCYDEHILRRDEGGDGPTVIHVSWT
jgi:hypothetical protein